MENEWVPKIFLMKNSTTKADYETKNKMGVRYPEGWIRDPRNKKLEQTWWEERKTEANSEGEQGPEGAVASYTNTYSYRT